MGSVTVLESLQQSLLLSGAQPVILLGQADADEGSTVLGCASCTADSPELRDVADLLPEPLSLLGFFASSKDEALRSAALLKKSQLCQGTVCLAAYPDAGSLQLVRLRPDGTASAQLTVTLLPSFEEWLKGHRIFRCELPLRLDVTELPGSGPQGLARALQAAVAMAVVQLDAPGLSYLADPSGGSGSKLLLLSQDAPGAVDSLPGGGPSSSAPSSGAGAGAGSGSVVLCRPLVDPAHITAPQASPCFSFHTLPANSTSTSAPASSTPSTSLPSALCTTAVLGLDVLCYMPRRCPLRRAGAVLTRGLVRQAHAAQRVLEQQGQVVPVRAHHFLPPGLGHHVTLLYPTLAPRGADAEANDALLVDTRKRLHALLRLPPNRPLLRSANALDLGAAAEAGGGGAVVRLRDVHVGLAAPDIGGTTTLLQGSYEYCHYMQDRFNDGGWGCAYRSLQTIVSWFRLQRYTSKPIPSHKTIQGILARLGDKPPSFVGSSNWIGAIELSYVLDDYLGVTCKVLTVSRGSDIPQHARELAAHFATSGTPVMIGGGVLAYTLLGVRFNEATGEAAFLILDPHYTGGEDLKKIQSGTWVGWKRPGDSAAAGGPLFVDDAFYNFLLPQRPDAV